MVVKFFIPLLSVKIKAVIKKNVPTDIQKNANLMKNADCHVKKSLVNEDQMTY